MLRAGRDVSSRNRYGSTARPSSRRCARSQRREAYRPLLGAHECRRSFADADAYLDFILAECSRRRRGSPRRAMSSSRKAPSRRAGAALPRACRESGLALRCMRTSSPSEAGYRWRSSFVGRSVDHLGRRGRKRSALSGRAEWWRCCSPSARSPLSPIAGARARRRGGRDRAGDRLHPGSSFCESLPIVLLARLHAAPSRARSPRGLHGHARTCSSRSDRSAAPRQGTTRSRCCWTHRTAAPRLPPGGDLCPPSPARRGRLTR